MTIKDARNGENITVLVMAIEEKETSTKKPYLVFTLSDGTDVVQAKQWDTKKTDTLASAGKLATVSLKVGSYQGKEDYTINSICPKEETATERISDYVKSAPVRAEEMYAYILKVVDNLEDRDIAAIVSAILKDNREKLLLWSAAVGIHHNYVGGLLYHVYRMVQTGLYLSKIYPVNKSVLVAGILLHDIGKLREMETDVTGTAVFTAEGNLFGHLYLGAEMFSEYAGRTNLPKEKENQIKHIILSHHGKKEWGAVAVPATLEALVVHSIDMIDSKAEQAEQICISLTPGTFDEARSFSLDGAHIYKPKEEK